MGQVRGHPLQARLAKRLGMVAVAPWMRLHQTPEPRDEETDASRCIAAAA
jgi:hypothetical protein